MAFRVQTAEMKLLYDVFPVFNDLFQQIRAADAEYAEHCALHYLDFLKGPPNRPVADPFGLLARCLDVVSRCRSGTYVDMASEYCDDMEQEQCNCSVCVAERQAAASRDSPLTGCCCQ